MRFRRIFFTLSLLLAVPVYAQGGAPAWSASPLLLVRGPIDRPDGFAGVEASRTLITKSVFALRVDAAYLTGMFKADYVCVVNPGGMNPPCDPHEVNKLITAAGTAVLDFGNSQGLPGAYALVSGGTFITRGAGGTYYTQNADGAVVSHETGAGPSGGIFQAGIGVAKPHAPVGWKFELRLHLYTDALDNNATGVNALFGITW